MVTSIVLSVTAMLLPIILTVVPVLLPDGVAIERSAGKDEESDEADIFKCLVHNIGLLVGSLEFGLLLLGEEPLPSRRFKITTTFSIPHVFQGCK